MVEVTVEITQKCNEHCPWCSSNATQDGKHLSIKKIKEFLQGIQEEITRINVSGGEPLLHPKFSEIWWLCHEFCDNVVLYTNAIKKLIFNSHVLEEVLVEANVCLVPGYSVHVPIKCSRLHFLKFIPQGRGINITSIPEMTVSRNFYDPEHCDSCDHVLLQANGIAVIAPCRKEY